MYLLRSESLLHRISAACFEARLLRTWRWLQRSNDGLADGLSFGCWSVSGNEVPDVGLLAAAGGITACVSVFAQPQFSSPLMFLLFGSFTPIFIPTTHLVLIFPPTKTKGFDGP